MGSFDSSGHGPILRNVGVLVSIERRDGTSGGRRFPKVSLAGFPRTRGANKTMDRCQNSQGKR